VELPWQCRRPQNNMWMWQPPRRMQCTPMMSRRASLAARPHLCSHPSPRFLVTVSPALFDSAKHEKNAVKVEMPSPARAQFISKVASFVAKDGAFLEQNRNYSNWKRTILILPFFRCLRTTTIIVREQRGISNNAGSNEWNTFFICGVSLLFAKEIAFEFGKQSHSL
jgi:hypothetical protein